MSNADVVVLGCWESPASWQVLASARARGVATVAFYESSRESTRHPVGILARVRSAFFQSV